MKEAAENDRTDLWSLIMFLVYEKKTLSLSDHSDKIKFYTQERFNEKMKVHLNEYKQRLNITYKSNVYSIITHKGTVYTLAQTENDARYLVSRRGLEIESVSVLPDRYEMVELDEHGNETYYTVKELKERATKTPSIIGGHDY